LGLHSDSQLRRGLARHKKLAIIGGTVTGLVASAGIAFAVVAATTTGGAVNGSLSYGGSGIVNNTTTATVVWASTPTFQCKQANGTFTGTVTLSADSQTMTINMPSNATLYDDAQCTLTGAIQDTGNGDAAITGFSLGSADSTFTSTAQVYSAGQYYGTYLTPTTSSPVTVSAGGPSVPVIVTITPASGAAAGTATLGGGFTYQAGPATYRQG
jgi:autotransporter translocation and assembly factor TamB